MDAAYTRRQAEQWGRMSEAGQHLWMLREIPGHYKGCKVCQRHVTADGRPKKKD